jgi:hypothetical protein
MDPQTRAVLMGAAGAAGAEKIYVEDVFSTYLYTGNGSTQTITNGIDLAGEGGLVWIKRRDGTGSNQLFRDAEKRLASDSANAETTTTGAVTNFNADGFSVGDGYSTINGSGFTYASWTFRKAEKFFDVVTYTGTGANRTVAHNLGSVPGCIIVKRTDTTGDWQVYHRANTAAPETDYLVLNSDAATADSDTRWNDTLPTSTVFSLGTDATVNASGGTYVAYLFAHDAGGFGDSGSESVVKCGSYTGNGSTAGPTIDLGWEPQFLIIKNATTSTTNWEMFDSMRGFVSGGDDQVLRPNTSDAEFPSTRVSPLATGFQLNSSGQGVNENGSTFIYIAIRRGPMKTPTDATEVFSAITYTGSGANSRIYTGAGFPVDAIVINDRLRSKGDTAFVDRLRGGPAYLNTTGTFAETTGGLYYASRLDTTGGYVGGTADFNQLDNTGLTLVNYYLRRAPGFFDVVAYTGTGANRTVSHNLGVVPELMIVKRRTGGTGSWITFATAIGNTAAVFLDGSSQTNTSSTWWNNTSPSSTVFTVGTSAEINASGSTYIAYLFATCPGVSKVGSYTGTGTTLSIDCGFTAGSRLVLIKRTDSTGDWFVWDTARGIVSGNDSYLLLNSTAAEVTNTDYIDPLSSGFQISSTAPAAINASGGSFIFLAIA